MLERLVAQTEASHAGIYVDTIVSPSFRTAVAQIVQIPGVSGLDNNSMLFEFRLGDEAALTEIVDSAHFAAVAGFNLCVLRSSEHHFGYRKKIHIWLTWHDHRNANLMILLAYILLGHRDWRGAEISIFAAYPRREARERTEEIHDMISEGRLLISEKNVLVIPTDDDIDFGRLVEARSATADLVLMGFTDQRLGAKGAELFRRFPSLRDVLFVSAEETIFIE